MKDSTKKTVAGAGAVAAGTAGAAILLRRKKLARIGTPVSKSAVVKHMPGKTRQVTGRVMDMAERVDSRLKEFISTEELPWSGGLCGSGYDKPSFPSLYLSRSTDASLMKMPGEGTAMVNYKIRSRTTDESRDDGQPLYGASIEIRSIEPIAEEVEEGAELSETLFLKHFAEARDRDGEGRYAAGNIPGADDFAIASQAAKKKPGMGLGKKVAIGAGAALAGAGVGGASLALRRKPLFLR